MASRVQLAKLVPVIEPDLKQFIDEVLVPRLVRDAMADLGKKIHVAPVAKSIAQSAREDTP
jgi:hypothetical protein